MSDLRLNDLPNAEAEWFPRPKKPLDVMIHAPDNSFSPLQIFRFLSDPAAEEWTDKVDISRSPTRLLVSQGWVFKTDSDRRSLDLRTAIARTTRSIELTGTLGVWHPRKTWFTLRAANYYWPCNATPHLITLQQLRRAMRQERQARKRLEFGRCFVALWGHALYLCVRSGWQHRLLLGPETENFGFEAGTDRVFYLDDEVYYFDLAYLIGRRCIWGLRLLEI
jgi:hypothetical protein